MTSASTSFLHSYGTQRPPPRPKTLTNLASTSISDFQSLLTSSKRILVLCGAGLSASSGIETFRGTGKMWRGLYQASALGSLEAFENDPGLVWLYFSERRHKALVAEPNAGHFALAELARKREGVMCLTQNADGLSQRADHPPSQLKALHNSLSDLKCSSEICSYTEANNFTDPLRPCLAATEDNITSLLAPARANFTNRIAFLSPTHTPLIPRDQLPHCPFCETSLLRPGVVWFGEGLPKQVLREVDEWLDKEDTIDLCLVVGTTAQVYPAATYVKRARVNGARVVVVNTDSKELGSVGSLTKDDFFFQGDAAVVLPEILKPVIGQDV